MSSWRPWSPYPPRRSPGPTASSILESPRQARRLKTPPPRLHQPRSGRWESTARLFVGAEPLFPLRALGERDGIEHGGALVAKDREGAADRAVRFVMAVAARRVEIDAR